MNDEKKCASFPHQHTSLAHAIEAGDLKSRLGMWDGAVMRLDTAKGLLEQISKDKADSRRDCGILLAQIDHLTAATGEALDTSAAALVEQIRASLA